MIVGRLRRPAPVRLSAIVAAALVIIVGIAPTASAHIRVNAVDASPGGYGLLTFRVPTESDTASTTEVIISFPKDTPITSVSMAPVPGWSAAVHTARLDKPMKTDDGQIDTYVTHVDWKADSTKTAIKPGEFELFNISAGPLPQTSKVIFPTDQHYSDGTVVAWDQIATGSVEPDHPAPALDLGSGPTPAPSFSQPAGVSASASSALGIVGIVLAVIAVVIALIALLRTRRSNS